MTDLKTFALALAIAAASAFGPTGASADPARVQGGDRSLAARDPASKALQEYRFSCSYDAANQRCTMNFTPTPRGKFATLTNASCLFNLKRAQMKFAQLLIMEGETVRSALALNPDLQTGTFDDNWATSNDRITAYIAARRFARIVVEVQAADAGSVSMFCHISGSY